MTTGTIFVGFVSSPRGSPREGPAGRGRFTLGPVSSRPLRALPLLLALALLAALAGACDARRAAPATSPEPSATCPAVSDAPSPLPGVRPEHRTAAYWIERGRLGGGADEVVLSTSAIEAHRQRLGAGREDLLRPPDRAATLAQLRERLSPVRDKLASGALVLGDGSRAGPELLRALHAPAALSPPPGRHRVALGFVPIRCNPTAAVIVRPGGDSAFDRNLCSTARPQELLEVVGRWPNGMWVVRTRYTTGWVDADPDWSPPVDERLSPAIAGAPRLRAARDLELRAELSEARARVPIGTLVPVAADGVAWFATAEGVHRATPPDGLEPTTRPLTRRALIEEAFALLDSPYGWGGRGGGRDCSRLLMDVFEGFGLELPRNSAQQSAAGTSSIDLSPDLAEPERLAALDRAMRQGVVLLALPGHIMLYLGRDHRGTPMVLHSLAEYAEPCAPGTVTPDGAPDTIRRVDRVVVSDLTLGRGSARRSLLERVTRVVILGR